MRIRYPAALSSFLLCCIAFASGSAAAQTSYPLVCQGGGAMRVEAHQHGILIFFRGASAGSSQKQPAAGECAWLDRGWREGEPQLLTWNPRSIGTFRVFFDASGRITGWDIRGDAAGNMKYLLDSVLRNQRFFVHAYRPTGGGTPQLRITRIGP